MTRPDSVNGPSGSPTQQWAWPASGPGQQFPSPAPAAQPPYPAYPQPYQQPYPPHQQTYPQHPGYANSWGQQGGPFPRHRCLLPRGPEPDPPPARSSRSLWPGS